MISNSSLSAVMTATPDEGDKQGLHNTSTSCGRNEFSLVGGV